jgi:hypothetical protein
MTEATPPPDQAAWRERQRGRNRALGLVLLFFVVLFFAIALVRIAG